MNPVLESLGMEADTAMLIGGAFLLICVLELLFYRFYLRQKLIAGSANVHSIKWVDISMVLGMAIIGLFGLILLWGGFTHDPYSEVNHDDCFRSHITSGLAANSEECTPAR